MDNSLEYFSLPMSIYQPGRFAYLMDHPAAPLLWEFLICPESQARMVAATRESRAAISHLLHEIESTFASLLCSPDIPGDDAVVFINNMVKQIMEHLGYTHIACGICSTGKYIRSSGVFGRVI